MSVEKEYYNYISFYRGIVVYVGKGKGKRLQHTLSGTSENEKINEFHFRWKFFNDVPLETRTVAHFSSEQSALSNEAKLIKRYTPYCNSSAKEYKETYTFKDKLESICIVEGYSVPEELRSKYDFRLMFTPKGLLCEKIHLNSNSPFEKTQFGSVKVKSDLYKHFPEFAFQFMENPFDTNSHHLTSFSAVDWYFNKFERGENLLSKVSKEKAWVIEALKGSSFEYLKPFKIESKKIDFDLFSYNFHRTDSHVLIYNEVLRQNEMKKARQNKAKSKRNKTSYDK